MISFVIPCYNSQEYIKEHLERLSAELRRVGGEWEILVVDDGSTDSTPALLREIHTHEKRIIPLFFSHNKGKGAAVKAGMLEARGDVVFFTDADLPYSLEAIAKFLDALRDADVVLGARGEVGVVAGQKIHRTLLSRLFVSLANLALREGVPDTQAGFKGFKREAAREIFTQVTIPRFAFDVEVIAVAQSRGLRVVSMPVTLVNQSPSTVRVGLDGFLMLLDLFRIFFRRIIT